MYKIIGADGKQYGPVGIDQLRQWMSEGRVNALTLVQTEGAAEWKPLNAFPEVAPPAPPAPPAMPPPVSAPVPPPTPPPAPVYYAVAPKLPGADKKLPAGICGMLLGSLGVHKFILGYSSEGATMLLVTLLTCGIGGMVMHVIGLVEGIIYLTKSDEEFCQTYIVNKKGWF